MLVVVSIPTIHTKLVHQLCIRHLKKITHLLCVARWFLNLLYLVKSGRIRYKKKLIKDNESFNSTTINFKNVFFSVFHTEIKCGRLKYVRRKWTQLEKQTQTSLNVKYPSKPGAFEYLFPFGVAFTKDYRSFIRCNLSGENILLSNLLV